MAVLIAKFGFLCHYVIVIYTIGYAGTDIDRFLQILKCLRVRLLIDVRTLPKSKYFKEFNDDNLSKTLEKVGIKYENWKREFGARQDNLAFYTENILDYEKFAESSQFKSGINKVLNLKDENICLMCAEIDPINCHRAILCGRFLFVAGAPVTHIIAKRNGKTILEKQEDFELRLMQITMINNPSGAYQKQNKKSAIN